MWWFSRKKPKEAWEETIQWPIGDIEAAKKIRHDCRTAADSAASVGHPVDGVDRRKERDAKKNQDDGERYKGAARTAMEIAMKMSDDLMRDASVSEILPEGQRHQNRAYLVPRDPVPVDQRQHAERSSRAAAVSHDA